MKIVFSRTDSWLSKLIRYFDSKGKWSHVSILVDSETVLDSRFPQGVALRDFNYTDYEIIEVEGDIKKAKKYAGKTKYDLKLFSWYGFKLGDKPWNDPNQMICSELVAIAMDDENVRALTPNQMYDYIKYRERN